jgi:hypothetical protein
LDAASSTSDRSRVSFIDRPGICSAIESVPREAMGAAVAGQPELFHHSKIPNPYDGGPNSLTLIPGTEGNVFGSFTPVKCESRKWDETWK